MPRTLFASETEYVTAPFETTAAKGSLSVEVASYTGSKEYAPHLQTYDQASGSWFDLWSASSGATSDGWTFYDMNRLFPPADLVEMYLRPTMRVRLALSGTGTITLSAVWIDAISTRQSA